MTDLPAARWRELDALLDRLFDATPVARNALLREVTAADPALARAAHALLADESGALLEEGGALLAVFEGNVGDKAAGAQLVPHGRVDLSPNASGSHYRIIERLAEGGMTEALARDQRLERAVTVKGLPVGRQIPWDLPALRCWAWGRMRRSVRSLAGKTGAAQDVLLNSWSRLGASQPRGHKALQVYLRRAVKNRMRDETRCLGRRSSAADHDHGAPGPSPLHHELDEAETRAYLRILGYLPEEDQELIVARFELGYSFEQLALLRARSPAAVRVAVRQAVIRLVEEMSRA